MTVLVACICLLFDMSRERSGAGSGQSSCKLFLLMSDRIPCGRSLNCLPCASGKFVLFPSLLALTP